MDNSSVGHLMEKTSFLERYNLTEQEFRQTGLEWPLLEQIHNQHLDSTKDLQSVADYVSGRLQPVPAVHSLKVRIKNAEHLIEKIIRKKRKTPNITFDVTVQVPASIFLDKSSRIVYRMVDECGTVSPENAEAGGGCEPPSALEPAQP